MTFTIRPNRENMQWIKRNTEKDARNGENAALDRWTTEGGSVADETNARVKKRVFVYREHKQKPASVPITNGASGLERKLGD